MVGYEQTIQDIIDAYESLVCGIDKTALENKSRAYGGIIRAGKGKLVESIAREVVRLAWQRLGKDADRIAIPKTKKKVKIPLNKGYLEKIKHEETREFIKQNLAKYYYPLGSDVQVFVDANLIMVIECKAYTENAMFKRILVDFTLLQHVYPKLIPVLLQLESQLGGDYSTLVKSPLGSPSTHALLSYFDVDLTIITLLKGERKVDKPIHKKEFYKPLTRESVESAIEIIATLLDRVT